MATFIHNIKKYVLITLFITTLFILAYFSADFLQKPALDVTGGVGAGLNDYQITIRP